jgi:hypothetical protein
MSEDDILEYYTERAAIAEHCGELNRHKAILQAYFELRKIYKGPVPEKIRQEVTEARKI